MGWEHATRRLHEIRLRDPFVLAAKEERLYFLYGTSDPNPWHGPGSGFDAYRSSDLERWEGPYRVFEPPAGFWGEESFWAPEVHRVDGRYLMLATFRGRGGRGTAILAGPGPLGPFQPHSPGAVTPRGWEALDGTLYEDRQGQRWLVFCHEWQQCDDGRVCAIRLSEDFRSATGEPVILFTASQAPWSVPIDDGRYVADGPFLHRSSDGALLMLWSSWGPFGYAQGIARSSAGDLLGTWEHRRAPIWEIDGGHGMIFRAFDERSRLILHHPNQTPYERPILVAVEKGPRWLTLECPLAPLGIVLRRFHRGGSRRRKMRFIARFLSRRLGIVA